jgi:heme exporter protein B
MKVNRQSTNVLRVFIQLLKREAFLEWEQKYTLSGILFYAFCMVFIISLSLSRSVNPAIWNGVFWIILIDQLRKM